jgi:hypothetical protein
MNIAGLKQSKFLTRADVGKGSLVTIKQIFQENVAKEGAPEEFKWCISFDETEKPMVLNSTNGQIIASIVHSDETDTWVGHKVVLYDDPNVSFGGKLVGGIRVRAPRNQPATPAQAPTHGILGKPASKPTMPVEPQLENDPGDSEVPF